MIQKPEKLLEELGIEEPNEIDIDAIAQFCGATIVYEPLKGCDARIFGNKDHAFITVNSLSSIHRQRFSAGHELGHWIRDRGKVAFICNKEILQTQWTQNNPETRANRFAANLLLPKNMFLKYSTNRDISFETAIEISGVFQTSVTSTAIQLVKFSSFPSILVWVDSNRRTRFYRSPHVPTDIWPKEFPGNETITTDMFKKKLEGVHAGEINAAEWIEKGNSYKYKLRESCIRVGKNRVLTLLWWQQEEQLIDLEEKDYEPKELTWLEW